MSLRLREQKTLKLSLKTLPEECAYILFFEPVTKILKLFFAKEFLFGEKKKKQPTQKGKLQLPT